MRARVLLLTVALQAAFVWWVSDSEIVQSVYLICYSLMMPTTLYLLCGGPVRRLLGIDRREFLFSYVLLTCTLPIIGFGGLRFLLPAMGWLRHFSVTQPQWAPYLAGVAQLPLLQDPEAVRGLYKGGPVPWTAWALPIAFWSGLLLLLNGAWLGVAALAHRVWVRYERLTFPITTLPLEVAACERSPFGRPAFLIGAAIPILLQSLLVLHDWYPSVPAMQLKVYDVRAQLLTSPPWSSVPNLGVSFYPMAIGLAYFMPGSVSLSCVVFWLLIRLAYPLGGMAGIDAAGAGAARFPFPYEQGAGAWVAFAALSIAGTRRHWGGMLAAADAADRRRLLAMGVLAAACMAGAAGMAWSLGLPPAVAAGGALLYAANVLSGARVRAEAGGVWTFAPVTWTPGRIATDLTGGAATGPRPLVAGAMLDMVYVDIRGQSLPYLMEALKVTETVGIPWRTLLFWAGALSVTALAFGWWFGLERFYSVGAATAQGNAYVMAKVQIGMNEMHSAALRRRGFDYAGATAILFGGGLTGLLALLRARFVGFPLHPVGYVLCNTFSMNSFFLPTLLAWSAKSLVLRYGGHGLYQRSLAFFVGLTLGDIGIQTAWTLVGRLFNVPIYQFLS